MTLFGFTCSACGTKHWIPRALAVACPVCPAQIGEKCRDLRSKDPSRTRTTVHPEREELLSNAGT